MVKHTTEYREQNPDRARFCLGCGAPILLSVGMVDAMRVSPDTGPSYEPPEVREFFFDDSGEVFEARNITGRRHVELQQSGDNRIDINSYKVGRTLSLGMSLKF